MARVLPPLAAILLMTPLAGLPAAEPVNLASLLAEMTDHSQLARWPDPPYRCLQASSYNRESVHRDQPGWFADQDGMGFLREEKSGDRTEWVLMEHAGPGCLTKLWTPFFYYSLNNHQGPNLRVYLDGSPTPAIDEGFIALTRGEASVKPPFAAATARAGNIYLPIPFAKSCKVTLTAKPFYYIINYRAYPSGTAVESFSKSQLERCAAELQAAGRALRAADPRRSSASASGKQATNAAVRKRLEIQPGQTGRVELPHGPAAVAQLAVDLAPLDSAGQLRSTVLVGEFDRQPAMWCPLGDFFCSADSIHPFHTWERTVAKDGRMTCRWLMPYRTSGSLEIHNFGSAVVCVNIDAMVTAWTWDDRSMHFHAAWRPDELVPGTPFVDWNFVDIEGQGVYVGDAWTVLNPTQGWWGEGDEKIYVDDAWQRGFPTHFGTGTEDYYGWAGGEVPTRADEFAEPFLANVRVGGVDGNRTRGFNILTRTRSLDAIPFQRRLRFDMEASPGTGQRRADDLLGYSAVTFFYARPGAKHNRPPQAKAAAAPIMSLAALAQTAGRGRPPHSVHTVPGAIECEALAPTARSPELQAYSQQPHESMRPEQWSGERHLFIAAKKPGDFVELTLTEQFQPAELELRVTTSYDFGVARIAVNGRVVVERLDSFSERPGVRSVKLGRVQPVNNTVVIRYELVEPGPKSRGARTFLGLDCIRAQP